MSANKSGEELNLMDRILYASAIPIELNDGTERLFLYTRGTDPEGTTEELRWMLRFFEETTVEVAKQSGSERIMKMSERVEMIKLSPMVTLAIMKEEENREELRAEVIEEIREEIRDEVREEVRESVRDEVKEEVRKSVRDEVKEETCIENARKMKRCGVAYEIIQSVSGLSEAAIAVL